MHVIIPLNISTFFTQAEILQTSFLNLTQQTTPDKRRVSFTKAIRDAGTYGMKKLQTIIDQIKNLDNNLPHNDTRQQRQNKHIQHIRLKRDIACAHSYSYENKQCGEEIDLPVLTASTVFNTHTTDSQPQRMKVNKKQDLIDKQFKLKQLFDLIQKEDKLYMDDLIQGLNNNTNPDTYIRSRRKRFILQAFSLFNDVLGTFMGAFNAHEIRQLKKQFNSLSEGHNMLVRVTQQHDSDIKSLVMNIQDIAATIEILAEYNPALMMMKIEEQLDQFRNRVFVLTNAIQQLQHRRLAIDLLSPVQMDIMHDAVTSAALEDGFTPLTVLNSDYYQIEVSYTRSDTDIIIIVHVPCTKTSELLSIYRYLPTPFPIPILPHAHDLTIAQSLALPELSISTLDQIFDQNDLDYQQLPEALFIQEPSELIAIGSDDSFQILSQQELTACVQKNHIYLCDKRHVVKNDLSQSCLGSLYLRQESGVRIYCKFERRPVQEIVYQLSDSDHIVFSPSPFTSKINCKNGTSQRIHFNTATKIHLESGCTIKLKVHTVFSDTNMAITPSTLQYTWKFDPFIFPSTMLENAQHLDHMVYGVKKNISHLAETVQNFTNNSPSFEDMINNATFSTNPISLIIWMCLAISSTTIFILFGTAVYWFYFRNRKQNNSEQHFDPSVPQIEHQISPDIIHTAIKQYLERQHHPINMNIPQLEFKK